MDAGRLKAIVGDSMNAGMAGAAAAPSAGGVAGATADPPRRRLACCNVMRLTTWVASPALTAAAASPTEPAEPLPPEVRVAENRRFFRPIWAAMAPGSIGAEYSANPSISSLLNPASSSAAMVALMAISIWVMGSDCPRLKYFVRPIPTIAVLSLSVVAPPGSIVTGSRRALVAPAGDREG